MKVLLGIAIALSVPMLILAFVLRSVYAPGLSDRQLMWIVSVVFGVFYGVLLPYVVNPDFCCLAIPEPGHHQILRSTHGTTPG
jgi:hypothetical protein